MTCEEWDHIEALRQIEFVGPERDDWRFAVMTAYIVKALTGQEGDPLDVLKVIQCRDDSTRTASPDEAARLAGGRPHGGIR